jgi:polyferredoxin
MEITNSNNRLKNKLKNITTEDLAKFLPWIIVALIVFFVIFYFVIQPVELGDQINFFLSSVIAIFAFIEGFSP